jgi:hypothetical protein
MSGYASPSPRKKGSGGRTSRVIPEYAQTLAKTVVDLPFDLFGLKWKRVRRAPIFRTSSAPARVRIDKYMTSMFGSDVRFVAAGGYGSTYAIAVTRTTRPILTKLAEKLSNTLYASMPSIGTSVLVKIAASKPSYKTSAAVAKFVKNNSREATAHVHLWRAPPVRIGGVCPVQIHARDYVPRFHFFGIDMSCGFAVTAMEYIKNSIPLRDVERVTPAMFNELEKALASFYAAAVDHSDLHFENILVVDGWKIKIIDYGFSIRIPENIRKKFVRFYSSPASSFTLNTAAHIFSMQHANAIQWKRYDGRLSFYNPSDAALRVVWHHLSPSNKETLVKHHKNAGRIISCSWRALNSCKKPIKSTSCIHRPHNLDHNHKC